MGRPWRGITREKRPQIIRLAAPGANHGQIAETVGLSDSLWSVIVSTQTKGNPGFDRACKEGIYRP